MTVKEELEVLKARIAELEKCPVIQYVPYYQYIQQPVYCYPVYQPYYLQQTYYMHGGLSTGSQQSSLGNTIQGHTC